MNYSILKNNPADSTGRIWRRSFRLGNIELLYGLLRQEDCLSFVFEKIHTRGKLLQVRRHVVQQIKLEDKVRMAYHSQNTTLKKV